MFVFLTCITYWIHIIILKWSDIKIHIWIFMQISYHSPWFQFWSSLLYFWWIFIEFHYHIYISLFNLTILIHKEICHSDDFTICLWHLNKIHSIESRMWHKKWITLFCNYPLPHHWHKIIFHILICRLFQTWIDLFGKIINTKN